MEKLSACPICEHETLNANMLITDHFLSREDFSLVQCANCGFVFTNPRPHKNKLGGYYESEDYFSHSKKKKGLITFLYDAVKNYSLQKKFKLISKHKNSGRILDIGCATGEFLNHFKKQGWETLGIEPAEQPREFAIKNYGLEVLPEASIHNLQNDSLDVITMWHVLEHVPDLNARIEQIKKLLKPDGLLVIALPNYLSWDAQFYKEFWAGYDVPRHLYHFSPDSVSRLLQKFDFKVFDQVPLKFDAFYVSLLSEKYKSGKLNYINAFLNGLKSNRAARKSGNQYSSLIYLAENNNQAK
jgi:SAM-dependent methyltransferase